MNVQDIEFEILNENNEKVNCCVIAKIPVDQETINIMYKRDDEASDVFRYGKVIKDGDNYIIKKDLLEEEYMDLRRKFDEEIVNIAFDFLNQVEAE